MECSCRWPTISLLIFFSVNNAKVYCQNVPLDRIQPHVSAPPQKGDTERTLPVTSNSFSSKEQLRNALFSFAANNGILSDKAAAAASVTSITPQECKQASTIQNAPKCFNVASLHSQISSDSEVKPIVMSTASPTPPNPVPKSVLYPKTTAYSSPMMQLPPMLANEPIQNAPINSNIASLNPQVFFNKDINSIVVNGVSATSSNPTSNSVLIPTKTSYYQPIMTIPHKVITDPIPTGPNDFNVASLYPKISFNNEINPIVINGMSATSPNPNPNLASPPKTTPCSSPMIETLVTETIQNALKNFEVSSLYPEIPFTNDDKPIVIRDLSVTFPDPIPSLVLPPTITSCSPPVMAIPPILKTDRVPWMFPPKAFRASSENYAHVKPSEWQMLLPTSNTNSCTTSAFQISSENCGDIQPSQWQMPSPVTSCSNTAYQRPSNNYADVQPYQWQISAPVNTVNSCIPTEFQVITENYADVQPSQWQIPSPVTCCGTTAYEVPLDNCADVQPYQWQISSPVTTINSCPPTKCQVSTDNCANVQSSQWQIPSPVTSCSPAAYQVPLDIYADIQPYQWQIPAPITTINSCTPTAFQVSSENCADVQQSQWQMSSPAANVDSCTPTPFQISAENYADTQPSQWQMSLPFTSINSCTSVQSTFIPEATLPQVQMQLNPPSCLLPRTNTDSVAVCNLYESNCEKLAEEPFPATSDTIPSILPVNLQINVPPSSDPRPSITIVTQAQPTESVPLYTVPPTPPIIIKKSRSCWRNLLPIILLALLNDHGDCDSSCDFIPIPFPIPIPVNNAVVNTANASKSTFSSRKREIRDNVDQE